MRQSVLAWVYFNPRSHEGSDVSKSSDPPRVLHFNPRSHEGSDSLQGSDRQDPGISIRAPTRGATTFLSPYPVAMRFQSALPRGERHISPYKGCCRIYFNPRSHEGSDLRLNTERAGFDNFNPRSHEGSDGNRSRYYNRQYFISIRAPTRGATGSAAMLRSNPVFQSALPRGERLQPNRTVR